MAGVEQLRLLPEGVPEGEGVTARARFEQFVDTVLPTVILPMDSESAIRLVAQVLGLRVQSAGWLYSYVAHERGMLDTGFSNRLLVDMNGLLGFVALALARLEEQREAVFAGRRTSRKDLPKGARDIVAGYPQVSKRIRYPCDIPGLPREERGELSAEDEVLLRIVPRLSEEEREVVASYGMRKLYEIYKRIPNDFSTVSFLRLRIEPYVGEVLRWNRAFVGRQLPTKTELSEFRGASVFDMTNRDLRRAVAVSYRYLYKHKGGNGEGARNLLDVFDHAVVKAREQIREALNITSSGTPKTWVLLKDSKDVREFG